jgi:hypothetical protein
VSKKSNPRSKAEPGKRKLSERTEPVPERLTTKELDEERTRVCDFIRDRSQLEDKRKAASAEWKARIAETDSQIAQSLDVVQRGWRNVDATIEEWLTDTNEVIRMRPDTGEVLSTRAARPSELQEPMFHEPAPAPSEDTGNGVAWAGEVTYDEGDS